MIMKIDRYIDEEIKLVTWVDEATPKSHRQASKNFKSRYKKPFFLSF